MPSKEIIFDNIEQYAASDLVKHIKNGLFTLDELLHETEGYLPVKVRKDVECIIQGNEEEDWNNACRLQRIDELQRFIDTYPNSIHIGEARTLISSLGTLEEQDDWQKAQTENTEEAYLQFLRKYPDSKHSEDARDAIRELRTAGAWLYVDFNDIESLRRFVKEHPDDYKHVEKANKRISELEIDRYIQYDENSLIDWINSVYTQEGVSLPHQVIVNGILDKVRDKNNGITQQSILNIIAKDHNLLKSAVVRMLIAEGLFSYGDLERIGIDPRFIRYLANSEVKQTFPKAQPLERIDRQSTEVYFWGIPSSGKSCALGAILSVAGNGTVARSMNGDVDCQGYGYMTRLSGLFKSDGNVGTLPESTSIYSTYEMGFDLEDEKGKIHPITCIDLAGELVRCMYKKVAQETLQDDEVKALETLTNILTDHRTKSRKIHFFVVEYGGDSRMYEGLSQPAFLDTALGYIERTGIFKEETDAVYMMLTKVDKTGKHGAELVEELTKYVDEKYRGFYQHLQLICKTCGINGGVVERIPFSLGEVCFSDFCLFNAAAASNVVRKLLDKTWGVGTKRMSKILKGFGK